MGPGPTERAAVLIIRAWMESDSGSEVRARLTSRPDVTSKEGSVSAAAGVDEICAAVRAWLDALDC